ncbi:primary cilium assembly protein FAM149B1 isoform X1 [Bufo bufo]|uniref:primary cilium assembly protein FAM149B1 isoform X1 n=1 Tax=Bufo bufo TaxID=8384 RepID=UPI001ABDFF41|nr:primary cilium assembly protein FAM149B1 isoform X1 [Bufo bufo]XP_040292917.1 primary cilium assembly protein FAM149B1 isoform X1 [Bufo bufo]XP_040292918.1 primary cilium assembly protein FAM149B1 isoform X1 [Bufo bufo]XP_040292919.1 primary cilium assembly protein FAM149B1 isoform X1 [Bufo bufo]
MISRYKRKPVSQTSQINQTLTKAAENHPHPDKGEGFSVSRGSERYEAASDCESKSDVSRNSGLPRNDTEDSWSEVQSCAGLSTDNSSVLSWGFDEFDQAATRQVQKIFKQIDELLYEQKASTLVEGLQEECHQWRASFPHLRIHGKQVVPPADDGYSWHSSHSETASSIPFGATHTKESSELGIFGTRFSLSTPSDTTAPVSFSLCTEEDEDEDGAGVIMSDGTMEEYLAFDSRDKDDEFFEWNRAMSLDSLKMGYPPISPRYCKKEAVLACLFDDVWNETVACLEELICRHWEESITDDDRHDIAIKTTTVETLNPYAPLQRLPLVLPPVHSKIPPISPNLCFTCNHLPKNKKSGKSTHANRSQVGSVMNQRNLNDLMMIHGIPLQQRNLHLMEKVQDSDDKSPMRPMSAALISGKPRPGRSLEHSSSSLSHNVPSARRRNPPRTLHPINNNPSRSGTPKMEEVIRGTRLQTANDQLPCSPVPFNRNNLLPPIGTSDTEYHNLPGSQRQTPDDAMRSFVISEHPNPFRYRRGSEGIDSISIGVTGIGLSIASSSANSLQWGQSINEKKEDREDPPSGTPLHLIMKSHSRGGPLTRSRHGL